MFGGTTFCGYSVLVGFSQPSRLQNKITGCKLAARSLTIIVTKVVNDLRCAMNHKVYPKHVDHWNCQLKSTHVAVGQFGHRMYQWL